MIEKSRKRIGTALVAAVATMAFAAAPASANTQTFENASPISVPTAGTAQPYPAPIQVSGLRAPIHRISVALHGVTHTRPQDLDVLLVSPGGRKSIVLSDVCGSTPIQNRTWVFPSFGLPDYMGTSSCPTGAYRPTDYGSGTDDWPGEPPGGLEEFIRYQGTDPDGTWRLYVVDDATGEAGMIERGWSLTIETTPPDVLLPAIGTFGLADPFPVVRSVSGVGGIVTDVDVRLTSLSHHRPDDLDLFLVGPLGQKVLLMSDACGDSDLEFRNWMFDDEAANGTMPDGGAGNVCPNLTRWRPTDHEPGDGVPVPAPPGPYGTSLSVFDLAEPNGDWRLYAFDDADGETGWFADPSAERSVPFDLVFSTRPKAEVAFAANGIELTEGSSGELTLSRTGAAELGAGTVTLTTTPDGATAGEDFGPIATPVTFAPGQTERAVEVETLADASPEGEERFTVTIGDGSGDAAPGTPASTTVTITDDDAVAGGSGTGGGGADADRIPPETTILKAPKPRTERRTASLRFAASEPGSRFECKVDRRKVKPCESPRRLKRLRSGRHRFSVRAIDAAGNADPSPAKRRWRVR